MESLQTLSARVLAKNNFNENFFPKKTICHQEIKKQNILCEFEKYKNFSLEIEEDLNVARENCLNFHEHAFFLAFDRIDTLEFLQKKLKELDEIIEENMPLIIEKQNKKEKMEEELSEKLKEFKIEEIQDSFHGYVGKNYLDDFDGMRKYYQQANDSLNVFY